MAVTLIDDVHIEASKLFAVIDEVENIDRWVERFAHGDQVWMYVRL